MKSRAFTLIELLVVVLIIGILSAIALPQYQKAVEKARMTEAIMAVEKIAQAQQIYKLANGSYTRNIEDLDIGYEGREGNYCRTIKARYTKNFVIAASNCSGDQEWVSIAQRLPDGAKYALAISLSGGRVCTFYEGATDYEKKLCQAWRNGN